MEKRILEDLKKTLKSIEKDISDKVILIDESRKAVSNLRKDYKQIDKLVKKQEETKQSEEQDGNIQM